MAGVTHIEIQESVEELEGLVKADKEARLKERIQALYLIKAQGMSVCAIAKTLGKHRGTVHRWLANYRDGGIKAVLEFGISSGRTRVIPNWAVKSLKQKLEQAEGSFQRYTRSSTLVRFNLGCASRVRNCTLFDSLQAQSQIKSTTSM